MALKLRNNGRQEMERKLRSAQRILRALYPVVPVQATFFRGIDAAEFPREDLIRMLAYASKRAEQDRRTAELHPNNVLGRFAPMILERGR